MLLGGITVPHHISSHLEKALIEAREPELPLGEIKWAKVSKSKLSAYKRFADVIIQNKFDVSFHSLFVDTHLIRDNLYNGGSREVGFNKEIYQLVTKFWKLQQDRFFHVYLDKRNTSSSTDELKNILNFGIRKARPGADWPIRRLHFRDSASCQFLQVVDVLLGAVAFHVNGHRLEREASPAKCELSDYILHGAGVQNAARGTARTGRFTIWQRQLRREGVSRP